jgi:hypothetical protein
MTANSLVTAFYSSEMYRRNSASVASKQHNVLSSLIHAFEGLNRMDTGIHNPEDP